MSEALTRIAIPSAHSEIAPALDTLERHLERAETSRELCLELRLVAEEILTNLVKYSGTDQLELRLRLEPESVTLEFRDRGSAFNPLESARPDLDLPLDERPLGGLGIHLVRTLADDIDYHRENDENVLRFIKRRS